MAKTFSRLTFIAALAVCATACSDDDNGGQGADAAPGGGDAGSPGGDGAPAGDATPTAEVCSTAVEARGAYSCAIAEDGRVFCWGRNHRGQLGDGTTTDSSVPVLVALPYGASVEDLAPGTVHACALDDGTVYCWGSSSSGQVGDGTNDDTPMPQAVPGLDDAVAIASGGFHACAIRSDDTLWCWGDNISGQIGDGTLDDRLSPVQVASGVAGVAAGEEHTCVLTLDGAVECWGRNDEGALGDGTTTSRPVAAAVLGPDGTALGGVDEITAGLYHTCARAGSEVLCWGANAEGQIDAAPGPDRLRATRVGVGAMAELTAGELHTCGLTAAGDAVCWGYNASGQLGQGDIQPRSQPMDVSLPGRSEALDAGDLHTCAVLDGEVWCWGYNASGQLGDGTLDQATSPVRVLLSCP